MSVLIPGVGKPSRCEMCVLLDKSTAFWGDCKVQEQEWGSLAEQYQHCPLVWIPDPLPDKEDKP